MPNTSRFPDDFSALVTAILEHGHELTQRANVVRIGVGFKVVGGVETHRRCITVFVLRKLPLTELADEDVVPARFHLHLTDVVEAELADDA